MPRFLLHPGFHKTGTSSAQHLLWKNRAALHRHVEVFQFRHLRDAGRPALRFSRSGDPFDLVDLADLLDAALAGVGPDEERHILLSHEGLLGHLPGWPGVADYRPAKVLIPAYLDYAAERFPRHDRAVILTTRAPGDWLDSAWRHHLMGQRLTEDRETFRARLAGAADLAGLARDLGRRAAPVPVLTADLAETSGLPFGPGQALLAPLGLPAEVLAGLVPVAPGNRGPDAALAADLLALNRSGLDDSALAAQKARRAREAGVGGWAR